MYKTTITALAMGAIVAFTAPSQVAAQWSLEGRVGSALPSGELANAPSPNQTAGFSFAFDGMYTFETNLTAYAGASRQVFNCDGCASDVSTSGLQGGLKYVFSTPGPARPWVRGGIMLHRSNFDDVDSDWGLGVDTGAGIDWLVSPRLAVVPALRLNSYDSGALSLTYLTLDVGLHLHLDR